MRRPCLVNAKYGTEPGIKAYSHVSDQFAPFAVQTIPATASEALYILDGLLMNDAGRRVREHYADTGGFTVIRTPDVFGVAGLVS
jgi:TnpA family transposase